MSDCDVCNDFKLLERATCDEKSYRWAVLKSLCQIIQLLEAGAIEPEVAPTTQVLPQVKKTAAQITSGYTSFATVGFLDYTKKLNSIRVVNNTDSDLEFSYDSGSTVAFTVGAYTTYQAQLSLVLASTTSLHMRRVAGQTASIGSVLIESVPVEEEVIEEEENVTNFLPQVAKTAAEITSDHTTFATVGLIDASKQLNLIRIINNTDCDLDFSYDGGDNVAFTVLSGATYQEQLNVTLDSTTSLQMKRATGQTAGIGSVLIEGRYNS